MSRATPLAGFDPSPIGGDSGEGDRDSGLIVISIPVRSDQPSERSDAGRRILQKVITIVKEKVLPSP
jgi:hypothetical protein